MSWLKKIFPSKVNLLKREKKEIPEGVWTKCQKCNSVLYRAELQRSLEVCPKCDHHMVISPRVRLTSFLDPGSLIELAKDVTAKDPLKFRDTKKYKDRLLAAQKKTHEVEALIVMSGKLKQMEVITLAFNFDFIGGSMGIAVGERFKQAVHAAIEKKVPLICFSQSGGARMQEGLFSLMQMAKVSAALAKLAQQKLPYISILTNPTMGGVSASLAMLGDIIIAEPEALIGFAGPRVIEQIVKQTLPEGFQKSEFLLEHGAIDMVVDRRQMRDKVARLLAKLMHR